jgi:vitamin B12 transporter
MPNKRDLITISILSLSLFALHLFSACSPALAQSEEEKNFLLMYFKPEELVVETPTRSPKPVSQVPENITVVTAADIELMNAHTLAEVLNTVTGVQVFMSGGPGQAANAFIQGSQTRQVTVFIDGINMNTLADNVAEIGMIPVQNIEKIEIIKGPASSAWGSALGGIVNIITKSGSSDNQGGMLSASEGTKSTGDFRAEARGKQNGLGYYVTAGRLQSDGLTHHMGLGEDNAYAKLTYDLTDKTKALLAFGYVKTIRDTGQIEIYDVSLDETFKTRYATLALDSLLTNELDFNISIRALNHEFTDDTHALSSGSLLDQYTVNERAYGSSAKLTWKTSFQTLVLGADYDHGTLKSSVIADGQQGMIKQALFLNDTLVLGNLAITPGIRYEKTDTNGNVTNPSLGLAYNLKNNTTIRAYAAKGYSIPGLSDTYGDNLYYTANPDLKPETVMSYEGGIETAALKYIWIKVSAFRHEMRDAIVGAVSPIDPTKSTFVNSGRERRQGLELEMKTAPVYNFSLSAGTEFVSAKNLDTNTSVQQVPVRTYDLGLHYDDRQSFRALLQGRYIDWNLDPASEASYGSFIFDLNMIEEIYKRKDASLEAFVDGHNIFGGSQYVLPFYKNPARWYEAGIRYKF